MNFVGVALTAIDEHSKTARGPMNDCPPELIVRGEHLQSVSGERNG